MQQNDTPPSALLDYTLLQLILHAKESPDAIFVVHKVAEQNLTSAKRSESLALSSPTVIFFVGKNEQSPPSWVHNEKKSSLSGATRIEWINHIPSNVDIKKSIQQILTIGVRPKYHDEIIRQVFSWWHSKLNSIATYSSTLTLPAHQLHTKIYGLIETVKANMDKPLADALNDFGKRVDNFFESLAGTTGRHSRPLQSSIINYQKALMENDNFEIEKSKFLLSEEWSRYIEMVLDDLSFAAQKL